MSLFKYKTRSLDAACMIRIASQGIVVDVDVAKLDIVHDHPCDELIVAANGERFDVLAGGQVLVGNKRNKLKSKLLSKQLLKRIEDMSLNGTAMTAPEPEFRPREDRGYAPRQYDDRDRSYRPRDEEQRDYRPRTQGSPNWPASQGAPYRPAPQNNVANQGVRNNSYPRNQANGPVASLLQRPRQDGPNENRGSENNVGREIANSYQRDRNR